MFNNFCMFRLILIFSFLISLNLYGKKGTVTGYDIPRFVSLKSNEVNMRVGPSINYPINLKYTKQNLPIEIIDEFDVWRKIRDHENNTGWIHVSQLSKKKAAIVIDDDLIMFKSPTIYSKPIVILKKGKLSKIVKCKNEWCKAKTGKYKGWLKKESLWGRL